MKISFNVKNQIITANKQDIIGDSVNYLSAEFRFSNDWNGFMKTVSFRKDGQEAKIVLVNDAITPEMGINLTDGVWDVFVVGVNGSTILTTNVLKLFVGVSGVMGGMPFDISKDDATMIVGSFNNRINVNESRLNALETSGTPEGSEVIGIRTGYDGTYYPPEKGGAGEAVRKQIGSLKMEIDKVSTKVTGWDTNNLYSVTHENGYYDASGALKSNANYDSAQISVVNGGKYRITQQIGRTNVIRLFEDNNGVYTQYLSTEDLECILDIPNDGKKYMLQILYYKTTGGNRPIVNVYAGSAFDAINEVLKTPISLEFVYGNIDSTSGEPSTSSKRVYTPNFICANDIFAIINANNTKCAIACYDDSKNYIGMPKVNNNPWINGSVYIGGVLLSGTEYVRIEIAYSDDAVISDIKSISESVCIYKNVSFADLVSEKVDVEWEFGSYSDTGAYTQGTNRVRCYRPISVGNELHITINNPLIRLSYRYLTDNMEFDHAESGWHTENRVLKNGGYLLLTASYTDSRTIESFDDFDIGIDIVRFGNNGNEYKCEISAIPSIASEPSITNTEYLTMCGVKYRADENKIPVAVGWLYRTNSAPFKFYWANGKADNMQYIFDWKNDVTDNGSREPMDYSTVITAEGDIIFVFRGEKAMFDLNLNRTTANDHKDQTLIRKNPVIYPHDDYNNPKQIIFPNGTAPTSCLQNDGYCALDGVLLYTEYTRPVFDYSYCWRAVAPYDSANNWQTVLQFDIGYPIDSTGHSNTDGTWDADNGFKHFHNVDVDPYTGIAYLSTGDKDNAAAIFYSMDKGLNWIPLILGSESMARQINFIWTKDYIYWATDSSSPDNHYLRKIKRNASGLMDTSTLEDLYHFFRIGATYHTCYVRQPEGLLILNRYDSKNTIPLDLWFYDLTEHRMKFVGKVYPTFDSLYGFRCEAVNDYQSYIDERIVCGWSYFPNQIDVFGNSGNKSIRASNGCVDSVDGDRTNVGVVNNLALKISTI